jgi:signal transduction histidine kinase
MALILSLVTLAGWQYREYEQEVNRARETLHRESHAIASALIGGFHSHRRRGRFFVDQIQGLLDGLVRTEHIRAVGITSQDGKRLLAAGKTSLLPEVAESLSPEALELEIEDGDYWNESSYCLVEKFELPALADGEQAGFGRGFRGGLSGGGPPDWAGQGTAFSTAGSFAICLVLDRSLVDAQCRSAAWLRGALVMVGTLLLLGVALAWQFTVRAAGRARLLEIEARNLRDLNQAAAGLAHETRNPLGLIRGWAQRLAQSEIPTAQQQTQADSIVEECDRVTARINQFLTFARPRKPRLEPIGVRELADELAIVLEPDLEDKGLRLNRQSLPPGETVQADREMLRQALFNLIQNAIQASPEESEVEIHIGKRQDGMRRLEILDHGPAIPTEVVDSLFTPYFTTRPEGTGLGLAIVGHIASVHGWQAGYTPRPGGGAIFWLDRLHVVTKHLNRM